MDCPSCGAGLEDDARYCPFCGFHVASTRASTSAQQARQVADTVAVPRPAPRSRGVADDRDADTGELVACPRCGSANSRARVVCGRCGARLQPERAPATAATPRPARTAVTTDREQGSGRRWVVVVVLAAAAVGTVLGIIAWLGLSDPAPAARAFDPAVYTGDPEPLDVDASVAGDAASVVDGDPETTWSPVEGATLTLRLDEPAWVEGVRVIVEGATPGRQLLIEAGDGSFDLELAATEGEQAVSLPDPVLTRALRVEVSDTAGAESLTLAEVTVVGWPAQGADLGLRAAR